MITNAVNRNDDVGGKGFVKGAFEEGDHGERMKAEVGGRKAKGGDDGWWMVDGWRKTRLFSIIHHPSSIFAALLLALAPCAPAAETANERSWRIWLEPKSNRPPVTLPIAGAERTVVCAGFLEEEGPRAMTAAELAGMGIEMERFTARARQNAVADLATLTPRYERNRKKVIEYAELRSERPIVASAVLAPTFLALWKQTLGEKVLVVVPNRFTAYVFPVLAGRHGEYSPLVFEALRATAWPVSVEVFEIAADGMKCVGRYEEP